MSHPERTAEQVAADPQPGDIYEGSWGYDQTNAEFWIVVKRTPGTVTIRQLALQMEGTHVVPSAEYLTERVGWVRGKDGYALDENGEMVYDETQRFVEKVCRLGRRGSDTPGASLYMKSYYSLYPWDGHPAWDTLAAGYPGH